MEKTDRERLGEYLSAGEDRIYRWVRKRISDRGIAEHICQDVCEDIMKIIKYNGMLPASDIHKLMFHIARYKIINYQKKSSTKFEDLKDHAEMDCFPLPEKYDPDNDTMKIVLYEHIRLLRDIEQKVIMGKINNWTVEELAAYLGKSPHAVDCLYSRTVKKLKRMIQRKNK